MHKLRWNFKKLLLIKNKYINYDYFFSQKLKNIRQKVNKSITLNINHEKAVKDLNEQGYFLAKNVFDDDTINHFYEEFDFVIEKYESTFDKNDISNSSQVRIFNQKDMIRDKLYACSALFSNSKLKKIIESQLEKKFIFNSEIFFQKSGHTKYPLAKDFHFDVLNSIKVWLYVDDCCVNSGPLEIVKKTHMKNKEIRDDSYIKKLKIDNVSKIQEFENTIKLTAPKGSIIIFNTDIFHRATEIKKEFSRKVIRGHSFSEKSQIYNYEVQSTNSNH